MHRAALVTGNSPAHQDVAERLLEGPHLSGKWAGHKQPEVLEAPALMMLAPSPLPTLRAVATETLCSKEEPDREQRRQAPLWRKRAQIPHLPLRRLWGDGLRALLQLPPLLFSTHHSPDSLAVGTAAQMPGPAGVGLLLGKGTFKWGLRSVCVCIGGQAEMGTSLRVPQY